jgi:hypothetical protein
VSAGFDASEIAALAALADILVPAAEGMPAASEAGMPGPLLDQVLTSRPDLRVPLRQLLQRAKDREPREFIASLYRNDPAAMRILGFVIAAGYYLSPEVKRRLNYPGQLRQPPAAETLAEYFAGGALQRVINRGPIWRNPGAG